MSRAGIGLAALIALTAALVVGAAPRLGATGAPVIACGPCHDGTVTWTGAAPVVSSGSMINLNLR